MATAVAGNIHTISRRYASDGADPTAKIASPTAIPPTRPHSPDRFENPRTNTPQSIGIAIGGRKTPNTLFERLKRSSAPCAYCITNVRATTSPPTAIVAMRAATILAEAEGFLANFR